MLNQLDKIAARVVALAALLGTIGLVAEVVVILIDVIGRYFGSPLRGAQDISQMAMVVLVFGGMALCDRQGGHIAIDIFERKFPSWLNRFADVIGALLGAVIFLGIAWNMWKSAQISEMLNLATNIINLPKAWFQYYVVAACIVTAFAMTLRAVTTAAGAPALAKEHHT